MGEARWRPREGQPVQQRTAYFALVRLEPMSQVYRDALFLVITVAGGERLLSVITLTLTQFGLKHCFRCIERQRVMGRILLAVGHGRVFGPLVC